MKTVEQIRMSNSTAKRQEYLDLSRTLSIKASELAEHADDFFTKKMAEETVSSMRKCESADCEYAAYTAAHATEVWYNKVAERA